MGTDNTDVEKSNRWFTCLKEDCLSPEGLLCFYDHPRSQKVDYSRELLAGCAAGPVADKDR